MRFVAEVPKTPFERIGSETIHLPVSDAIAKSLVRMSQLPRICDGLEKALLAASKAFSPDHEVLYTAKISNPQSAGAMTGCAVDLTFYGVPA